MWRRRGLLLVGLLSGCTPATSDSDADDAGPPRVKPRLVSVELPPVVHRTHEVNEDGSLRWSTPEPVEDAEVCVVERRDAYALFRDFEALDPPICVTPGAGKAPELSGIPANSDLILSVKKPGYLSTVLTLRVEGLDLQLPGTFPFLLTLLFDKSQAALFQGAPGQDAGNPNAEDRAHIALAPAMTVVAPHDPYPEGQTLLFYESDTLPTGDAQVTLDALDTSESWTLDLEAEALLLDVGPGSYRAHIDQPRTFCEPTATLFGYTLFGLGTDAPEEVELRVLPGHVSFASFMCVCIPPALNAELVDPFSCSFAEPEP